MAGENVLNYEEQGGDVWAVGGTLRIDSGGKVVKSDGTQAALTDLVTSVGTADGTVADVGGAFNQTTLNNNFADLAAAINALNAALRGAGISS